MKTENITQPEPAVTVDTVKGHLRLEGSRDDGIISEFIGSAVAHVETTASIALMQRQVRTTLDGIRQSWPPIAPGYSIAPYMPTSQAYIELQARPLIAVTSIEYFTKGGTDWTTWDASEYVVSDTPGGFARIGPADGHQWPSNLRQGNALRVDYTVGFGDNLFNIPNDLRLAVTKLAVHLYTSRGEDDATPPAVIQRLIAPHCYLGV